MANRKGGWIDRTLQAVKRQIAALKSDKFEIGVKAADGRMMIKSWDEDTLLRSVGWLKRENAKGADVYIRPHPDAPQRYVLVDDIDQATAEQMSDDGIKLAAVVETSPKNCQAWVCLPDGTTPAVATTAARILARRYDADPNSADFRHFGRLAGFTNRKPEHTTPRGQPFVLLRNSTSRPEPNEALAAEAAELVRKDEEQVIAQSAAKWEADHGTEQRDMSAWVAELHGQLAANFREAYDSSRADWLAATVLYERGYSHAEVAQAIALGSPEMATRKRGHQEDYVRRTVGRAEVWAELKGQGARYADVRDKLSELAEQRAQERAAAQQPHTTSTSLTSFDL